MTDTRALRGELDARSLRIAIVVSRFNELVGEQLLAGAFEALTHHGASRDRIDVIRVPGAFEIPATLKVLAARARYDALIALGAVIRGETAHFEYVAGECARGVAEVSRDSGIAVGFGVLTVDTLEQALARAGADGSANKGAEAAMVAVEMAHLFKRLAATSS